MSLIARRQFGRSGPELSAIAYGAMRLAPSRLSPEEALALLSRLLEAGVTTFHSSHEYDSHSFFCDRLAALRRLRPGADVQHVIKLASPHFDARTFSARKLGALIDQELTALGAETVDLVQWMARQTPNTDENRLAVLEAQAGEIQAAFDALKASGKIRAWCVFPYSPAFAERSLEALSPDGLCDYRNPFETETAHLLGKLEREGRSFAGIRPFAAGRVFTESWPDTAKPADPGHAVRESLRFALDHPAICTTIVTATATDHVDALLAAAEALS